jgi:small subunit ribosomal protein S6
MIPYSLGVVYLCGLWYNGMKFDRGEMAARKKVALKVEDKRLLDYELVYIVSPEVSEESLEGVINGIGQFVTGKDGVISDVERWGKKRLAYPVKHFLEGNYVLTRFKINPARCKELEANLKISEDILRHLLIKLSV